jgi:hypothetical protein
MNDALGAVRADTCPPVPICDTTTPSKVAIVPEPNRSELLTLHITSSVCCLTGGGRPDHPAQAAMT